MSTEKIKSLTVVEPRLNTRILLNSTGAIIGLIIALISILMMISIILFIPGVFGVLIGLVIVIMNAPKTNVICPSCDSETKAQLKAKNFKCEYCETITPLVWVKEPGEGNKLTSWSAWKK